MIPDGANVLVTLENLQQYIDLVVDQIFNKSIRASLEAFKKGFNQVIPVELLKHFDT